MLSREVQKELTYYMEKMRGMAAKFGLPFTDGVSLEDGFTSSRLGSAQPTQVFMTPIQKRMLIHFGDIPEDGRLMVNDPQTHAEKWVNDSIKKLLETYFPGSDEYDESVPLRDVRHYNTQCHRAYKDNYRQIQPGQAEERLEMIKTFSEPFKEVPDPIKRMWSDPVLSKTVEAVLYRMPVVHMKDDWVEVNTPFMTKHSNVGFKWWAKDTTLVPGSDQTYGQLTLDIAKSIPLSDLWQWNLATMYGRNQRKGRLIVAIPRVINLSLNRLQASEIERYRDWNPMFVGYGDDVALQRALTNILLFCEENDLVCSNTDFYRYDSNVSPEWILLENAMRVYRCADDKSKQIALMRGALELRTRCICGLDGKIYTLWGRIFSGEIDTNMLGGNISGLLGTYCNMKIDPHYTEIIYNFPYSMLVMGDDCLAVHRKTRVYEEYQKAMASCLMKVNHEKDEFGPFFLQYRVFEDPDTSSLVMSYAFPRVIYSSLMRENSAGLGPAGWYLSFMAQAAKLMQCKRALKCWVNLLYPFDEYRFFEGKTVRQIIDLVNEEDKIAFAKLKTDAQKKHFSTTFEKLNDGDPSKAKFFSSMSNGESPYLHEIHNAIHSAVDSEWLSKAGIKVPKPVGFNRRNQGSQG